MRNPTSARLARRGGVWILMWLVLLGMGLEWLTDKVNTAFRAALHAIGLKRLEDWLRRRSLWFIAPILTLLVCGWIAIDVYKARLLWEHQVLLVLQISVVQKLTYGVVLNYLLHLYADQLLTIAWIARSHAWYVDIRARVRVWVRSLYCYARALELIEQYRSWKRQSLLILAQRSAAMHRCCIAFG